MITLSISKNWQDYLIAVISALVGILTAYVQASVDITVPVVLGVVVVILNAILDVNKKENAAAAAQPKTSTTTRISRPLAVLKAKQRLMFLAWLR